MSASSAPRQLDDVQARVGYRFSDPALLNIAMTHLSVIPIDRSRIGSYQRLEFLGDRVLGLAISDMLYREFPEAEEGELSRRLAGLVRRETCAEVAVEWGVGSAIKMGDSERASGGQDKPAILSDVCEAVIGAVFVEAGFEAAAAVVQRAWTPRMRQPSRPLRDPKTSLQEWAQSLGRPAPLYRETERSGPDHAPVFTVSVTVDGFGPITAAGSSKRAAEQGAAEAFLKREGILPKLAPTKKAST